MEEFKNVEFYAVSSEEEMWPFKHETLQLVVSNLHLNEVNNIPVHLLKIHDSLIPDGFLIGSTLGNETLNELRISYTLASNERKGGVGMHTHPFLSI